MKKEPTKKQMAQIFITGLVCLSLGMWLIFIPFIGMGLIFFGGACLLLISLTIVTMILNKILG